MTRMRGVQWAWVRVVAIALLVALGGCSDDDRPGDRPNSPVAITGNAVLLVVNHSYYLATVYFDEQYIGMVRDDGRQTWNVPVGEHVVRADNAELDNTDAKRRRLTFRAGETTRFELEEDEWGPGP